jgi:hypothetical protein
MMSRGCFEGYTQREAKQERQVRHGLTQRSYKGDIVKLYLNSNQALSKKVNTLLLRLYRAAPYSFKAYRKGGKLNKSLLSHWEKPINILDIA